MDEEKRYLVRRWLTKAFHDLSGARFLAAGRPPSLDLALFYCQRTAENALKGYLVSQDQPVEKTHDIGLLIDRAMTFEPEFSTMRHAGDYLTPFARAFRGLRKEDQHERVEFEGAMEDAEGIYRHVLSFLPPEVHPEV